MKNSGRLLAVTLSVALLSGTLTPLPADARVYRGTVTRELRAADSLMQTGRYAEAEAKYTALLNKNPGNIEARSGLALAQSELYKLDAAEKNANAVLAKDPNHALAHVALGVVYRNRTASQDMTYKLRRDELLAKSAYELEMAVIQNPKLPEAHNQLGVTYRFQGRYDGAEQAFERALELDSDFAEALLNYGIMRLERNDVAGAKELYQKAIRLNSKNHMAHYRLGEALLKEGQPHLALKSLNTALSLDRNNASIMAKMGEAYEMQGNDAAAVANYQKAIHANPGFMPAHVNLANLYDFRGDGELAMSALRNALNTNPNYAPARNRLGQLALSVDKPDQAIRYFKESLHQNPQDPVALHGLAQSLTVVAQKNASYGQTLGQEGELVNAELAIHEALRLNPNDLRLHLASLHISKLTGKPAASQAELQRIIAMQPQNETERMLQGEAFLALGRYGEADQIFHSLMQESKGNVDKLLVIGDTLKASGDLQRAQDAYRMALLVEPGNLKAERGIQRVDIALAESERSLRLADALNNFIQKKSSVDFYEESLANNPRQPEARLELAKLYEKYKHYDKAILSYRYYLGLVPDLSEKKRQKYEKKIAKLQEKLQELQQAQGAGTLAQTSP